MAEPSPASQTAPADKTAEHPSGPITLDSQPAAKPANPRLVPYVDYSGDLWHRPALTGDWGGARQKLMDKGVSARQHINLLRNARTVGVGLTWNLLYEFPGDRVEYYQETESGSPRSGY